MNRTNVWGISSAGVVLSVLIGLTGCTKMIQPDQLSELKQLRAQEIQLNQSISDAQSRKQRLEREIAARQDEVKRCKDLQATLQSRLNAYPGNLGDTLPESPPPPPPTMQKKGRK